MTAPEPLRSAQVPGGSRSSPELGCAKREASGRRPLDRFVELAVLIGLVALAGLATARGVMLARRGVRLFPIDRERRPGEALSDLGFLLAFLLWGWECVALALPHSRHLLPEGALALVVAAAPLRLLGLSLLAGGAVVYALAVLAMGASWRLGIDREHPGALVTDGVFACSRNPIYVGLALLTLGASLALGRLALLLLCAVFWIYFSFLVRREEAFLASQYGDAYRDYCTRVGRWWTVRSSEPRAS